MVELILLVMPLINRRNSRGLSTDPFASEALLILYYMLCFISKEATNPYFLEYHMIQFMEKMTM